MSLFSSTAACKRRWGKLREAAAALSTTPKTVVADDRGKHRRWKIKDGAATSASWTLTTGAAEQTATSETEAEAETSEEAAGEHATPEKYRVRIVSREAPTPPKLRHKQAYAAPLEGKVYKGSLLDVFCTTAVRPEDIDSKIAEVLDALHRADRVADACADLQQALHGIQRDGKILNWSRYIHAFLLRKLDPDWNSLNSASQEVLLSTANELRLAICARGGQCTTAELGKSYSEAWNQLRGARIASPTLSKFISHFPDMFKVTREDGADLVRVQFIHLNPTQLLGICDKCSHALHGAPCPWHPHAAEVRDVVEQHLQPTMRICLKDGMELEIHHLAVPPGRNELCLHAKSQDHLLERTLHEADLVSAEWVVWRATSELRRPLLLSSGHGVEFNHARARVFASASSKFRARQGIQPCKCKAVILDARLRNYEAMLENGWRSEDLLIIEQLPLTALYQQALGAAVFCGRLEEVLFRPPAVPGWLKQHVEDTVAVYVDLCGDCEGRDWKMSLSAALANLTKLEMYMVARNMRSLGRVPRLEGFLEVDCFFDHGVECWLFFRSNDTELQAMKQHVGQVRRDIGLPEGQQQWKCKFCLRIESSHAGKPKICSHCRKSGSMIRRRWCEWCKTRANLQSLRRDPNHPDVHYCRKCWTHGTAT
eukprot:TRINITY_DN104372_c0_g1_i1.p1 TRINITY_DN104372_c0_g1~~TRINITY_DN104372_c0_g1_i1.p1  ORF type:complete len:655 (-),score=93.96 TRINITY_DN104372_c0_g1_i1:250-2214(-)